MPNQPVYSIGAVVRMLRISAATLRTWEHRYGTVIPVRSAGGQRLYSQRQVEQLRLVGEHIAAGLSPADAHRLLRERLDSLARQADKQISVGPGLLIVLSELDPRATQIAEYLLRTERCDVAVVTDAKQAAAQAVYAFPSLLMVELSISNGRGLELRKRLQDRFGVIVTAVLTIELREATMTPGKTAILHVLRDPLLFVSVVRDILGHPSGRIPFLSI